MRQKFLLPIFLTAFFCLAATGALQAQQYFITGPSAGNAGLLRTQNALGTTGGIIIFNSSNSSTNAWSPAVSIPFTFEFYGTPVTQFCVSQNRLLTFDVSVANTNVASVLNVNTALPNASLPNNTIAYLWGDFADPGVVEL